MRQIKFRAWDKRNKKISYFGSFFSIDDMDSCGLIFHPKISDDHNQGNAKDFELMQFTELKDKNGKEIYEGDIVICDRHEDHIQWQIEIKDIRLLPDELRGSNLNWREVIGNIYENPELLQEKK